jgi:opine dehydrogenase
MAKRITILGAGNGGHALSFYFSKNGHRVMLFEHPNFAKNLEGITQRGGIEAVDKIRGDGKEIVAELSGFAKIDATTTDIKEALDYSNTILMVVPSFAQEPIFELAIPHLRDGQMLVALPGNFASLVFKRMMKEAGVHKEFIFAETNTIPPACRVIGPGQVFILAIKKALEIAALPSTETKGVIEALKSILHLKLLRLTNVLETGFANANMIVHPATAVLNMGLAESRQGQFYFYKEGMSDSVSKVQQRIDDERLAIGAELGLHLSPFVQTIKTFYNFNVATIREFALTSPIHSSFGYDGPKNPRDRYVSEDCPYLLVPVYEFGKLLGIRALAMESVIRIASIYNDADYFKDGRNLEKLGLSGMSKEQILNYVQKGV